MNRQRYLVFMVGAITAVSVISCSLFDDDVPGQDGDTGAEDPSGECTEQWESFLDSTTCAWPTSPMLTATLQGSNILLIDDPKNGTSIGPNGWLFGNVFDADWVGYVVEGDVECGIGCFAPPNHACNQQDADLCVELIDGVPQGCLYCGPATISECGDFLASCNGSDLGGSNEAGESGSVDETGADGIMSPDVSMFNDPYALYVTTPYVIDWLGDDAPHNLVTDICDAWNPAGAVGEWLGDFIIERDALYQAIERAEVLLGHCDKLRLTLTEGGVKLVEVVRGTLAAELWFKTDDVLLELNGIPATDAPALMAELYAISQDGMGVANIEFLRDGAVYMQTIRVQ